MTEITDKRKVVVIGAGPVGALAALYAAVRGDDVEVYELRGGTLWHLFTLINVSICIQHRSKGSLIMSFITSWLMFCIFVISFQGSFGIYHGEASQ